MVFVRRIALPLICLFLLLPAATHAGPDENADQKRLAEIADLVGARIPLCWAAPENASAVTVRVQLFLNPDGTLAGEPKVLNSATGDGFRLVAESALRAVKKCMPIKLGALENSWTGPLEINLNFKREF